MPIPDFDNILNIMPPHMGNPATPGHLSPYHCTIQELCLRFSTTPDRLKILRGFLGLRAKLFGIGIRGSQWLAGSFVEDIETQESRSPRDIDAVTFVCEPGTPDEVFTALAPSPELVDPEQSKAFYSVDHYIVPMGSNPRVLVYASRYWYGLFSHRRDNVWKGILLVDLVDEKDDVAALAKLDEVTKI